MKSIDPNNECDDTQKQKHSHAKHLWMMAFCCGLPVIGFLTIAALGINAPSLETLIALICPIGMVAMMVMMMRDKQSCCSSKEVGPKEEVTNESSTESVVKQTATFKA